ncbi:hypothetical protein [Marinoscillum sp.]|uniref:hypothetical protein n=1 Tax=Marinoscillum sp. TaxID=2024838 RepID=UPI003BAD2FE7
MKTKTTTDKEFDAVQMMREIRNKIDRDTENMTFEQLKEYYRNSNEENRKKADR